MSFPRDPNAPLEDPEGDRIETQERADRVAEKNDPHAHPDHVLGDRGLRSPERDLWETARILNALKTEHCNTGQRVGGDKAAENREWMGEQFAKRGLDYTDIRSVAYAIGMDHGGEVVGYLAANADGMSTEEFQAFLGVALANAWIDGALTTAMFVKDGES